MKKVKDGFQKRLRIRIGKLKFLDFLWLLGYYLSFFLNLKNMINTVVEKRLLYFVFTPTNLGQFSRFEICWSWHFQNTPYMCNFTKFWLRYLMLKTQDTILLFSWELIWEDEKNRNLNNLIQKLFCSTSKVPISTTMIFRNTIKRSIGCFINCF